MLDTKSSAGNEAKVLNNKSGSVRSELEIGHRYCLLPIIHLGNELLAPYTA